MKSLSMLVCTFAVATATMSAAATQSGREAAVAIDKVAIPPADAAELQLIASRLNWPWSMAFLPDGRILVSEKPNGLRIIDTNGSVGSILAGGPPNVFGKVDSGHLDVVIDPDFTANRLIYIAYVEGTEDANRTAIWKARLENGRLTEGRTIFRVNVDKKAPSHPGGRMLFLPDGTLLLTVGDGFDYREAAQNLKSHLGKVLRLTTDGTAAPGNPFTANANAAPEVWTSGHRNIQGLALDAATGNIWSHEHGPRGGDEINLLKPGANYGWPTVSHGIDYDGTVITDRTFAPGYEPSKFFWAPSVAPSGLTLYRGDGYADWDGKFFVGGLASRSVVRVRQGRDTGLLVEEDRMFAGLRTRIRDVRTGPDGRIYLLTDEEQGRLLVIVPTQTSPNSGK
jgi:glucose/arabinose dehydrogenase